MANKVTIEVEATFVDEVTGKTKHVVSGLDDLERAADDAQKKLNKLGKQKAHPVIDADNNKFLKKLRDSENKVARIAGKTFTASLKVVDKGTSIVNKLESGLKKVVGKTWTTMVKIKDFATAPLVKLKNMLFSIKSLVLAITAGLAAKQLVINPINLADQYSSAKIGFSTLLGETEGQQMMNNIDAFAKATPFKTSGVISNVQKMMAYGWDADKVIDDMKTIGDAAAATGKGDEGLSSIVYALSEIRSKGKLSTQELNQLASAGIKAKQYLAEGLGFGTDDAGLQKLSEALEDGAVGANQAIDLILQGMKEFDGMMDKTANETIEGLWGQITDTFEINIFRKWGQGLQDGAKRGFGSIVTLLDEADGALEEFGDTVYEVGKTISNWLADKLEKAVKRITEITDTFEFKNASLGEKLKMLWKGVISDPLKEWWEGGGKEKTAKTAGKIGSWMGEMLTKGLLAIFGATDILDEKTGANAGENVAGSFLQGFLDNFDGSAITKAFVDAISNVWGALPWWAKLLIGGYGTAKAVSGISSFIGAAGKVLGSASAGTGLLGFGANTAINLGAGNLAGGASLGAGALSALGLGATAGGITAGAGIIHAIKTGIAAHKAYQEGDDTGFVANTHRSFGTIAGLGLGAAVGAKAGAAIGSVGGPVGTLIGAGLGTAIGWFAGDKIARNIESAKYESEELQAAIKDADTTSEELNETWAKAKWENAKEHFGDIKLSLSEIERLVDQIVWGDDMTTFESFTSATKSAQNSLENLKAAAEDTNRWMWKASLGVKFNEDEKKSIKASFDDYINSAKSYVENKHYEFSAAVSLLVDVESEEGKSIIDSGNSFYGKMKEDLDKAGKELGDALTSALEDGIINADESKAIIAAQQKIAEITNKIANAESNAEMNLIKVKFGEGNLDIDSFENFMTQMRSTIDERMAANDEAFVASVSSLNLQLAEGAITQEEYDKQLATLTAGYEGQIESLQAEVKNVELQIIGEAYADELGSDAAADLENALQYAIDNEIDPIEISDEKLAKLLNVDELSGETADNIKEMLSGALGHLELLEVDGDILLKVGEVETEEGFAETLESHVKEITPDQFNDEVEIALSGEATFENAINILAEDFGIDKTQSENILWALYGTSTIQQKIAILKEDFGINSEEAANVLWRLTGSKSVAKMTITARDFGIPTRLDQSITVNLTANKGTFTNNTGIPLKQYRGGIVGGSSSMEAFARGGIAGYSNGGMVRGGARLITVAEEGSPEMIIPLSSQRRGRALKLWAQAGHMMGVPGFARGGLTNGGQDEGIRFHQYGSDESVGGQTVQVDVGGITFEIVVHATDGKSIVEAIREQKEEIAETIAGVFADSFGGQFENTPTRGGAA